MGPTNPAGAGARVTAEYRQALQLETSFHDRYELRSDKRRNRSHVDMPPIGAYRQALEPFRAVNESVGPFISDFRAKCRISELVLLDLRNQSDLAGGVNGGIGFGGPLAEVGLCGSVTAGKL
jgi:hypothetical protein